MRTLPGALVAATALAALVACSDPKLPAGCTTDSDCPAGRFCSGGACVDPPDGGGGAGGSPVLDECDASDDCQAPGVVVVPSVYWDGTLNGDDPLCTVPQRSCPGTSECPVATICTEAIAGATRLGSMRCARDEQCASGRCVSVEGTSLCFRACELDSDCPAVLPPLADPAVGFRCDSVLEDGIPLRLCVPIDPTFPDRTLCASDCDCAAEDGCPAADGGRVCRFIGQGRPTMHVIPVCDDPLPDGAPPASQCSDPSSCAGGGCGVACIAHSGGGENFCVEPPLRCVAPCGQDADCPPRTSCRLGFPEERVGSWASDQVGAPGREIRYCQLPSEGCYDELDCCPAPDGAGGCIKGWSPVRHRCGVNFPPPAHLPRLLTTCLALDPGLATPGQCCAGHEGCDSNLCVPARPGTPCAGGGVCSVPCDPDPQAGGPSARDRCALFDFGAQSYHRDSSCQPFTFVHPYTDASDQAATLEVVLNACQ